MEEGATQVVTFARHADVVLDGHVHCLELLDGSDFGPLFILGRHDTSVGRSPPADLVLADTEVSRLHCRLSLDNDVLTVTDLNSTNGTFVDGVRVVEPVPLPVGAVLRIGRLSLKHEWRTEKGILQHQELDRELKKAHSYVQALLPPPIVEGPIRSEWLFEPCSRIGGDAFGYGPLNETQFLIYMIDVSGHGAGAAMHSVAVMNLLRQRALPRVDMARPEEVLTALNAMFQMDDHAGMYFTMWYGVYDRPSRQLRFGSAGHHPAFLRAGTEAAAPLRTRGGVVGADPGTVYRSDTVLVPPDATLYLFSDGVFEIVTKQGVEWRLGDFVPLLTAPGTPEQGGGHQGECQRLYQAVRGVAQAGGLDDDFSLLVLNFD